MTPKETDPDLPMSVRESLGRRRSAVACCTVGGTECSSASWDLLKEVAIIFITSTIVWPQVKLQGENTAPPINRKLGLLSMALFVLFMGFSRQEY